MIRFVSKDGMGLGTQLLDAETGEDLQKIVCVEYGATIEIGQLVKANCKLAMIEVDVIAGKTEFHTKHPVTGEFEPVAAIEFQDGTRVTFSSDGTPSVSKVVAR